MCWRPVRYKPHMISDGWLNRALAPMGLGDGVHALAVAQTPPLLLTGPTRATSWMPRFAADARCRLPGAGQAALCPRSRALSQSLDDALSLQSAAMIASDDPSDKKMGPGNAANLEPLFAGAGRLLAAANGPRVAVLDISGWDTHINEGAGDGAAGAAAGGAGCGPGSRSRRRLGPAWGKTAIVMATEFGRTARPNGNGGTDHGTGGASFLLGGAVAGGMVRAEWTGLSNAALQDGRDQPAAHRSAFACSRACWPSIWACSQVRPGKHGLSRQRQRPRHDGSCARLITSAIFRNVELIPAASTRA